MPKIKEIPGKYRFSFLSYDVAAKEPMHIHMTHGARETKLWLRSMTFAFNKGFRAHELREIRELAEEYRGVIERHWKNYENRIK